MIAQRFGSVGWVAGIAVAATGLYMISLRVASERGKLEAIDLQIAATKRDIRQLQTELGTRASLRQLERWNGEVLSLSAPRVGQYLVSEQALASADSTSLGGKPSAPPAIMTATGIMNTPAPAEGATTTPALLAMLTSAKPKAPLTEQDHAVQRAILAPLVIKATPEKQRVKAPLSSKPERVAMLDTSTMRELSRSATAETTAKAKK